MKPAYLPFLASLAILVAGCECGSTRSSVEDREQAAEPDDNRPTDGEASKTNPLAALDQKGEQDRIADAPRAPTTAEEKAQAMEDARAAFECFAEVDQEELRRTAERGQQVKLEIAELCTQRDRAAAEALLAAFQKESAEDKSVKALKECGSQLRNALPSKLMMMLEIPPVPAGKHVCDDYAQIE